MEKTAPESVRAFVARLTSPELASALLGRVGALDQSKDASRSFAHVPPSLWLRFPDPSSFVGRTCFPFLSYFLISSENLCRPILIIFFVSFSMPICSGFQSLANKPPSHGNLNAVPSPLSFPAPLTIFSLSPLLRIYLISLSDFKLASHSPPYSNNRTIPTPFLTQNFCPFACLPVFLPFPSYQWISRFEFYFCSLVSPAAQVLFGKSSDPSSQRPNPLTKVRLEFFCVAQRCGSFILKIWKRFIRKSKRAKHSDQRSLAVLSLAVAEGVTRIRVENLVDSASRLGASNLKTERENIEGWV